MSSREKILKEIVKNKPAAQLLPSLFFPEDNSQKQVNQFLTVLQSIGGEGTVVDGWHEVLSCLQQKKLRGEGDCEWH